MKSASTMRSRSRYQIPGLISATLSGRSSFTPPSSVVRVTRTHAARRPRMDFQRQTESGGPQPKDEAAEKRRHCGVAAKKNSLFDPVQASSAGKPFTLRQYRLLSIAGAGGCHTVMTTVSRPNPRERAALPWRRRHDSPRCRDRRAARRSVFVRLSGRHSHRLGSSLVNACRSAAANRCARRRNRGKSAGECSMPWRTAASRVAQSLPEGKIHRVSLRPGACCPRQRAAEFPGRRRKARARQARHASAQIGNERLPDRESFPASPVCRGSGGCCRSC